MLVMMAMISICWCEDHSREWQIFDSLNFDPQLYHPLLLIIGVIMVMKHSKCELQSMITQLVVTIQ
jgi:predicted nucleic-acid-binding protein